jgi:hypothetical protein
MKLDVRDKDFVWCVGEVKLVVESPSREPLVVIRLDDTPKTQEEVLQKNSPRLALLGTYTNREELPSYEIFSSKIVNLIQEAPTQ